VAEAVTTYQRSVAERLRQAEMERAQAQVKAAEERKRRKLSLALAGSVLCIVLLGSAGWVWIAEQKAEQRRQQAGEERGPVEREELERERAEAEQQARRRQEIAELLNKATTWRADAGARGEANARAQAHGHVQRALALLEAAPDDALQGRARTLLTEMEAEEK